MSIASLDSSPVSNRRSSFPWAHFFAGATGAISAFMIMAWCLPIVVEWSKQTHIQARVTSVQDENEMKLYMVEFNNRTNDEISILGMDSSCQTCDSSAPLPFVLTAGSTKSVLLSFSQKTIQPGASISFFTSLPRQKRVTIKTP